MKRDMNLIRRIAIATADLQPGDMLSELPDVDANTFGAHVQWMLDAGLVEAKVMGGFPDLICLVLRLTWAGSDFLDAARDEALWRRAMSKVLSSGAAFTFEILKEALKAEITKGFPSLRGGA